MPTFIFYRLKTKIDRLQGADTNALEAKIRQHIGSGDNEDGEEYGQGMMDLGTFIMKNDCECLNEADDHPMVHSFTTAGGFLQSDCDEQLILSVTFNQAVKIHSLKFKAPEKLGPKNLRIFINQPRTIDFDMANSFNCVQELTLEPKDLQGNLVNLRFVKFQNVQNIQIFIKDNQSGGEVTQIDYIGFIGGPIITTKMDDFKRIAGKKGESH